MSDGPCAFEPRETLPFPVLLVIVAARWRKRTITFIFIFEFFSVRETNGFFVVCCWFQGSQLILTSTELYIYTSYIRFIG